MSNSFHNNSRKIIDIIDAKFSQDDVRGMLKHDVYSCVLIHSEPKKTEDVQNCPTLRLKNVFTEDKNGCKIQEYQLKMPTLPGDNLNLYQIFCELYHELFTIFPHVSLDFSKKTIDITAFEDENESDDKLQIMLGDENLLPEDMQYKCKVEVLHIDQKGRNTKHELIKQKVARKMRFIVTGPRFLDLENVDGDTELTLVTHFKTNLGNKIECKVLSRSVEFKINEFGNSVFEWTLEEI